MSNKKLDISLLLVEDDRVIRSVYEQVLIKHVKKLYLAIDGADGYDKYLEYNPDIIVTDIKMPIVNGLEMIRKIRTTDQDQRIIIMSAYSETRFFLKAIELGVKGFLVKPVEIDYLKKVVNEQANDILLEKRLKIEAAKRRAAEQDRDRGELILKALSQITAIFLNQGFNNKTIKGMLKLIGEITNVSRSYIFELHDINSQTYVSQTHEWSANNIKAQINNDELVNIPLTDPMFTSWAKSMNNYQNVMGFIEDFSEPTKSILASQDILSLLVIPIYVKKRWWGFIGFDDCKSKRIWTNTEINALEMLALNIGAALYRQNVESELKKLNATLEDRVWNRTKELEQQISERIIAENMLRDSEEKYRLIYENANDGIILLMDSLVQLVNPKFTEIIDLQPKEIIGKKITSLVKQEHSKTITNYLENQLTNKNIPDIQIQLHNKKWIEIKSTNILWDDELANLIFISDITKRKDAQDQLNDLNKNLEIKISEEIKRVNAQQQLLVQKSKLESIGELSAGLAHEINQPLGGISMGLDNILYNTKYGKVSTEYLTKKLNLLFKDIERIRKIIEHVRLFSRDQDNLIVEEISVNEVIKNALSLISKQFESQNINLNVSLANYDLFTLGNRFRLEQVFLNILSNAKQAFDGKIKNLNYGDFVKQISIITKSNNSNIIISITDNGIGIDKNIISEIFNPFFTTKSEEKGTGLGLSISYGIISEMKGAIDINSIKNEFTTVVITLPKRKNNE